MIPKLLGIFLLSPSVFTQFAMEGVHPDVTFGEGNDRFDLTDMIQDTNKMFHQNAVEPETEDFRRELKSSEENIHSLDNLLEDRKKNEPASVTTRRDDDDFAYHDKMDSNEGGTVLDFEHNLKHFMGDGNFKTYKQKRMGEYVKHLHGDQPVNRRSESPQHEKELLMHYAMPVVMKIDGFLKVPLPK